MPKPPAEWIVAGLALLAALGLPLLNHQDQVLTLGILVFLNASLAASWNIIGGFAGQVNLGHAAFYGLGTLVARLLWLQGVPFPLAFLAAGTAAAVAAFFLGYPGLRLKGIYFAIGTLALGEILRTTVGNALPEISTLPAASIAGYRLAHRYYLALALAAVSVIAVALLAGSRVGLGMQAIREDEQAAEASGVGALRLKLTALALSTALAGLAGGLLIVSLARPASEPE